MNTPAPPGSDPPPDVPVTAADAGGAADEARDSSAHQLNNLLQVVSGYLELLARRTDDPISRGYIETAQTALARIIDDL